MAKGVSNISRWIAIHWTAVGKSRIENAFTLFTDSQDGIDSVSLVHPVGLGAEVVEAQKTTNKEQKCKDAEDTYVGR